MPNDITRSFWQRTAAFYNRAMRGDSAVYEEIAGFIRPYLTKEKNVLELACGTGLITHRLSPCVRFWEATDYSEAMIRQAKKTKYGTELHFSVQDAAALPYAEETFDAAVITNALHIIDEPTKTLAEIRRVLKADGVLFAPNYVREESGKVPRGSLLASFVTLQKKSRWTEQEYLNFLKENGFYVIEEKMIGNGARMPVCFAALKKAENA